MAASGEPRGHRGLGKALAGALLALLGAAVLTGWVIYAPRPLREQLEIGAGLLLFLVGLGMLAEWLGGAEDDGRWLANEPDDVRDDFPPLAAQRLQREIASREQAEEALVRARGRVAELEQRLSERTEALDAANRELEAYSYTVAHDLRAPVRAVEGFSHILEESHGAGQSPEARHLIQRIRQAGATMSTLIEGLLAFSRLGKQEIRRSPVALAEVAAACLDEMREEIVARNVEVHIGELPACEAHPTLMATVFRNLLDNALKYTRPRERAVIEVGCREAGSEIAVYVRDNGVGFEMRDADKLFGVFRRLHSAREFEGSGMGLATVDRIIQRHGGRVWAESKAGHGATFWFSLRATGAAPGSRPALARTEPSALRVG